MATESAGRVVALDVRGLEPPEPMIRVLEQAQALRPGDVLEVSHHREPIPLYAHLEQAGFGHETAKLGEGRYRVRIWRKDA